MSRGRNGADRRTDAVLVGREAKKDKEVSERLAVQRWSLDSTPRRQEITPPGISGDDGGQDGQAALRPKIDFGKHRERGAGLEASRCGGAHKHQDDAKPDGERN